MPSAAARLDDDYGFGQPAPKKKPRRRAASKSKRKPAARAGKNQSRYIRYAAVGLTAVLAVGIVINALALQNSRHPAPLFGKAIQLGDQPVLPAAAASVADPAKLVAVGAPVPVPPATPAPNPQAASSPKTPATSHDGEAPAPHAHHAALDTTILTHHPKPGKAERSGNSGPGDDPIAAMLKTASPGAPAEKPAETSRTILGVQHALMKIGYVVAPDGNYGAATRTAIQAFEREQHLPVTGELSRKLLKQLSAESGVAID